MLCTDGTLKQDPALRLAMIGVAFVTELTHCERGFNKPFNPILGETYELVTDSFEFLAE